MCTASPATVMSQSVGQVAINGRTPDIQEPVEDKPTLEFPLIIGL